MHGRRWLVLGCLVISALGASAAKAGGGGTIDGGTITFVGAIVEPTCSALTTPSDVRAAADAAQNHQSLQRNCFVPVTGSATSTDAPRPYEVDVVHLSSSESDRVLSYFANYVRAAQPGSADPMLVTQTYD